MRKEPLINHSPTALIRRVGEQARARRVALGLTRPALAERVGVSVETIRRFETTGQIAVERLVRLALALQTTPSLDGLFPPLGVESLEDLERASVRRQRGVRRDASASVRAKLVRVSTLPASGRTDR